MSEIASAFVSLIPSARDFPKQLDKQVSPGIAGVGKKAGLGFGKAFGAIAALGIGAKVVGFLGDSLGEAREAQKVGAQTTNVLKSMGLQSKVTADQIGAYATKLSLATGVDDELIQSSQNTLLTFGNLASSAGVTGGAFQRASALALDMSTALGTDLQGATVQVGKALNDPIKGITALSRSGVSFTEQQKKTIKSLVEGGKVGKAQGLILNELGKEFKGSAAAQATAGEKASVAFGNLKETIGTALLPVVDRFANIATTKVIPAISSFVTGIQSGTGVGGQFATVVGNIASVVSQTFGVIAANIVPIGTFVGIIGTAVAISKAFAAAQLLINVALTANPIGIVVVAIAGLAAGLVYAYKKSDTFRAIVNSAFAGIKKVAAPVADFIGKYVPKAFAILVTGVKTYINIYKTIVVTAFNVVRAVVQSVGSFIGGAVKFFATFASGVKDKISQVTGYVKALPGKIKGFFTDLPGELKTIGGNIIDGLKEGIKAAGQKVLDAVQNIIDKIPKFIRKRLGIASPSKVTAALGENIIDGLAVGMRARAGDLLKGLGKITDKVRDKVAGVVDGLKSDFASLSDSVGSNLTGDLFSGFDTASSFLGNLGTVKGNLGSALADFKTLKGFGLPTKFLAQLFSDGGFPLIHELASDQGAAQAAGSLFGDIQNLSGQLGGNVADTVVGPKLDEQTALLKAIDAKLGKMPEKTGASVGASVNGAATGGKKKGHRGK